MPRALAVAVLLLLAGTPARAEPPVTAEPNMVDSCVTAGCPDVEPQLWQRTWGVVGFYGYPVGDKMAPNGVAYDPLFSLDLLLNIALTADRSLYLFGATRFWTQKATAGVTNRHQGAIDFSKRQFDLDAGVAWNCSGPWEARLLLYSDNNLNRGTDPVRPTGFNDGVAAEGRYYLDSTSFDQGLYRFLALGYCFTKEQVGGDGRLFKPALYARASVALDLLPRELYLFADVQLTAQRPVRAKLLWGDVGVAARPIRACPDLEFRLGAETTGDVDAGITRSILYGHVRIVW